MVPRLACLPRARRRMRDIEPVIDALLAKRPDGFRNKHLTEVLGVSAARARQLLAGESYRASLRPRCEPPTDSGSTARHDRPPAVSDDAELGDSPRRVVDFEGVRFISAAASRELFLTAARRRPGMAGRGCRHAPRLSGLVVSVRAVREQHEASDCSKEGTAYCAGYFRGLRHST
jgi:hypothetical protein